MANRFQRDVILSWVQYVTGWVLLLTFSYAFLLSLFVADLVYPVFLFPTLMLGFILHAVLGIRSTVRRYRLWKPWVDGVLLALWLTVSAAFVWAVYLR